MGYSCSLGVALEAVWDAIGVRDVNRLINSMKQRCQAVIAGDLTYFSRSQRSRFETKYEYDVF
jgi:hypothetical protein